MREVTAFVAGGAPRVVIDGTVGLGGHTEALLEALPAEARVVGLDRDPEALERAQKRLERFGRRVELAHACYSEAGDVLKRLGVSKADGFLLDLGLSSAQLEDASRGMSFLAEGPLDMRFDRSQAGPLAKQILARSSRGELARIFKDYGEEPRGEFLARRIVETRRASPFQTTTDLARFCESTLKKRGRIHPATKVFQALRIEVNRELERLTCALDCFPDWLSPGGTAAVLSYHSLEDRCVKRHFRAWAGQALGCVLTPKPVRPGRNEALENPRARSARLRAFRMALENGAPKT